MPGQGFRGLAERVALVTDGARGIGRAVALQLAFEGAYVIVGYGAEDSEGERVAGELRELGTLAHAVKAEIVTSAGTARLFGQVNDIYGRLDLLVQVASSSLALDLEELSEEAWEAVQSRDLKSAFLCAQAAARLMRERPAPAIINVVSAGGGAHHAAAHAGVIGLTKALAHELAPRVRVNCVAVGRAPGREEAPPADEVARACVYLLSPEARYVTGQVLTVGSEF